MQAIGFTKHLPITNEESLMAFNLPSPKPKPHDLCVQVTAVSVNPVDVGVRKGGRGQSKTPRILGWDAVGIVTGIGNGVTLFKPGDRVFYVGDFKRPGSNSEYQLVDERIVAKAPQNLTDAQAAAMPLTALTAWEALFEKLHIDFEDRTTNHDQTILIINGAGGVGSIATQLAHLAGLHVIATASRPETQKWALAHGADQVVNHHQSLIEQVHALGYQTVDYILELNNIDQHWESMARLIKPNGRIASITENHRPVDLQKLTKKRVEFAWEWVFSKTYYQTTDLASQGIILGQIATLLEQNKLQSTLTKCLSPISAANLRQAHQLVETNQMIGKVVVAN